MLSFVIACVSGCVKSNGNFCLIAKPLTFNEEVLMVADRDTMLQIKDHNDKWEELCQ